MIGGALYQDKKSPNANQHKIMTNFEIDKIIYGNSLDKFYYQLDIYNNEFLKSKNNIYIAKLLKEQYNLELYDLKKSLHRRKRKKETLKKNLDKLINISDKLIFGTITFNEESINIENKRNLVKKYLDKHKAKYICNVDYGEKNNRQHYHVIINTELNYKWWKYGAVNFKRIPINIENNLNLRNYLTKLNRHAMKYTTISEERIIYKLR